MSKIEDTVITKIAERAEMGLSKYGVTMERDDLSRLEWLQHAQEEAMDLAVYLQRLIEEERARHDEAKEDPELGVYGVKRGIYPDAYITEVPIEGSVTADLAEIERERRMKIIGQNGNDGLHYGTEEDGTGYVNYPKSTDRIGYFVSKSNWANKDDIQKSQQDADKA